ncbi:MAG: hypothetical protein FJ005_01925 [Chloroflexi bacterium]|nr:hypothetical protein [Chloroflexota bacterium]
MGKKGRQSEPKFQVNDTVTIKGETKHGIIIDVNWVGMSGINIDFQRDLYIYKVKIGDAVKDVIEEDIIGSK